jgi:hypothetical protein
MILEDKPLISEVVLSQGIFSQSKELRHSDVIVSPLWGRDVSAVGSIEK